MKFFTKSLYILIILIIVQACSSTKTELGTQPDNELDSSPQETSQTNKQELQFDDYSLNTKFIPQAVYPLSGDVIIGPPFSFAWTSTEKSFEVQLVIESQGFPQQVLSFSTDKQVLRVHTEQGLTARSSYQSISWSIRSKNGAFKYEGQSNQILNFPQTLEILKPNTTIEFEMGSNNGPLDERPQHKVKLDSAFFIATEPMTNRMIAALANRMLSQKLIRLVDDRLSDNSQRTILDLANLTKGIQHGLIQAEGRVLVNLGYEEHPAIGISWHGAWAFIAELNRAWQPSGEQAPFDLPTEAEWELAASAGMAAANPWLGEVNGQLANYERSRDNFEDLVSPYTRRGGPTSPVTYYASMRQRAWRLPNSSNPNFASSETWRLQMIGNIWEWCADWYGENSYQRNNPDGYRLNPKGPSLEQSQEDAIKTFSGRVLSKVVRGAAWDSLRSHLYAQKRGFFAPEATSQSIGFRIISRY